MAASIRLQILQVIRDAVDAVLLGGCDMPRRRGLDFSVVPCAVVFPEDDTPQTGTTRTDGGVGRGGVQLRTLTVNVDVYMFDPDAAPVSDSNPTGDDPSTVELLDEQLVIVEKAIKALWINEPPTALGTLWRTLAADGSDPSTSLRTTEDGQRLVAGRVTMEIRYQCAERDPAEAA